MNRLPDEKNDEPLAEYDFRGGVRGKYAGRFAEGINLVLLDPDVISAFPTADAVNSALRTLIDSRKHTKHVVHRRTKSG